MSSHPPDIRWASSLFESHIVCSTWASVQWREYCSVFFYLTEGWILLWSFDKEVMCVPGAGCGKFHCGAVLSDEV